MKSALIIDDDAGVTASISTVLIGYAKKCAHSMSAAIKALQEHEYDVVFLDLKLPDSTAENTLQMLPMMRRLAGEAAFVLMTGCALEIGNAKYAVDSVLRKPFHSGHIREALADAQLAQTRYSDATGETERMTRALLAFV